MRKGITTISLFLFIGNATVLQADENQELQELPEPPAIPDQLESGETIEPEVTIIRREDATIEEYRINGQRYMVKITPIVGKPYYLVDKDGDGTMESRMSDIYNEIVVPQWVLFSW